MVIVRAWMYSFLFLLLLLLPSVSGGVLAKDRIKILSVTPDSVAVNSGETELVVEVEYELGSRDEGVINLGFNVEAPRAYVMGEEDNIVKKGRGRVTLTAKLKPSELRGKWSLYAYVNLSEHPHARVWKPLADAKKKIKVRRKAA